MPKAARIDDTIAHTGAFTGMLVGLAAGVAIGAIAVATGGAGLVLFCAVAATGAKAGGAIGKLFVSNEGVVASGAKTVRIGRRKAARAVEDTVDCHVSEKIAQGSRTVVIEDFPAARIGDKTVCDGTISSGSANVEIGMEPGTYAKIGSEIPLWLQFVVELLDAVGSRSKSKTKKPKNRKRKKRRGNNKPRNRRNRRNRNKKKPKNRKRKPKKNQPRKRRKKPSKARRRNRNKRHGRSSKAPKKSTKCASDPVDVATGAVVDAAADLSLPGPIPVRWVRHYSSDMEAEDGPFGPGGWTHDFDQWVIEDGDVFSLRAEEGRDIYFARTPVGEPCFHRAERKTLFALADGCFEVHDHVTRMVRIFEPLAEDGPAFLRRIEDAHGNYVDLFYGAGGLERVVDTAGREIVVIADSSGHVERVEVLARGEVVQWVDYDYHPTGELAAATDAMGGSERYEYDDQHCLIHKTLKNGVQFHYEYDEEDGRCVSAWGDGGIHAKELEYDDEDRTTTVHGDVESRFYEWNEDGAILREATFDGDDLLVRGLDEDGLVVAEGPTDDALTRFTYDARGNLTRRADPAGNVTQWEYQGDLPVCRVDPDGQVTRFSHDEKGEVIGIRYPSGAEVTLVYDSHGRLSQVREADRVLLERSYDGEHNVRSERDARGGTTEYEHDAMGRSILQRDALGRERHIEYDLLGRPIRGFAPDGTSTEREFDVMDNLVRSIDALGQETRIEYTGTGVVSQFAGPDGQTWLLSYDEDERVREIRNPAHEMYAFDYDEAGRVVREKTFDGRLLGYNYTEEGYVESVEQPDGSFRMFEYDDLGNVVRDTAPSGVNTYERDSLGRITRAEHRERSGKVVTEVVRDRLGRIVTEKQNGRAVAYEYDMFGRRTSRVLPDGSITRYAYDAAGDIIEVEHDGRKIEIDRDVLGRETARRARDRGVELHNAYDHLDRLVERRVAGGEAHALLSRRTWRYDSLGRPAEIGDSRWGTTIYGYDSLGQLVSARRGAHTEVFQYDVARSLRGIFSELSGVDARVWDTDMGNVLTRTETARYEHDANGRRTKKVVTLDTGRERRGDVTSYMWDDWDQLREVVKPDGERVLFTYDALGRRVRKEVLRGDDRAAHVVVEFLWDGNVLAAEEDSRRGRRVFVHEPGTFVPMLQAEQGEVFLVVNDHLGTPKEMIDQDGRVAWSAAHSAWGQVIETWNDPSRSGRSVESPFRLLGQYADEETGLCYTRFRYFDAETGRWCSPDPLGLDGGVNLFGFDGAPTDVVDPLGLSTCQSSRREAFREAKRDARIPMSQQPKVRRVPMTDKFGKRILDSNGRPIMTREYVFKRENGSVVVIQDHSAGHYIGQPGEQGPHFNVRPAGDTRHGKLEGTQDHYPFKS